MDHKEDTHRDGHTLRQKIPWAPHQDEIERQIAIYEVTLAPGIVLERNRVGLRNLLRKYWKVLCIGVKLCCALLEQRFVKVLYKSVMFCQDV